MAPLAFDEDVDIHDLTISSLELDARSPNPAPTTLLIHRRDTTPAPLPASQDNAFTLSKRQDVTGGGFNPGAGTRPPESFNNNGFLALFAIIGAAMVVASLWFFFWAKNGGFKFQEGDWDDYKSTVLRRKGPDGKTLSNATKSTKLGGSTIAGTQRYHMAKREARSVVGRDEKGRKGIRAVRGFGKTHSLWSGDISYQKETFSDAPTVSDMTEIRSEEPRYHHVPHHQTDNSHHSKRYRDRDVQDYKRERPARVGGLNRVADGSHIDTSTVEGSVASSAEPILPRASHPGRSTPNRDREKERAERKAREEAARMERRWKKEAEEAAAALARENARPPPAAARSTSPQKKVAAPSTSRPAAAKTRSQSPKKREQRDFSYQRVAADAASEVLSTAYMGSSGQRTASYYDSYRPLAEQTPGQGARSPQKKAGGAGRSGGYRRGMDSDLG